ELAGQLFEIGRHGPVELKSGPDSRPWLIQMLLNPRTSIMLWLFRIAFVGLVVALLWLIGWSNVGIIFKDNLLPWIRKRTLLVCGIVIAVILAVCLTKFGLHHHPHVSRKILAWCIAGFGVPVLAIILCGGFHREERTLVDDQTQISLSPRTPACHGAKEDPHTEDTLPPFGLLAYLAIAVLFCVLFSVLPYMISSWPGEESSGWSDGVSIWPTEIIRFFVVVLSVGYFAGAHRRNSRHYRTLWWDYMREGNYKQVRADIKKSRTDDTGWMRIRNVLVANWATPRDGSKVDARMLLAGYLKRAHARNRYLRALPLAALYLVLGFTCVQLLNGMPNRICVRGSWSWLIDNVMLMLSVMSFLVALFLSLDGARLTARLLDGIGSRPTSWPQQLLDEWSSKCGVRCSDLDGYLDVRFAVDKTRESRVLMFFPFVIFLLLLISREHFIENWTWTPELAAVFAFNFLLAGMCWWIVRRSATKIREEALQKLGDAIKHVNGTPHEDIIFTCPTSPVEDEDGSPPATTTFTYSPKDYAERLTALRKEIEDERRGAFALWIQDPTYLALFLPTGVTGIVAFLLQYWLPHS
ncbi:MAG TPA: hypothetical protein VKV04_23030, partial [Verrucomicrobiae bacterium]|nr:hypothetical protein [Verrucomicrobiae bacterium]